MRGYIIRRLLLTIPTVFFVSLIIFVIIRLIPGSVVELMVANSESPQGNTKAEIQGVESALGLNVPIYIQYGRWIDNIVLHGDLGKSLWQNTPVIDEIRARWAVTLELGILALLITQIIAFPIGIFSALRQDTWGDYLGRSFAILCIAVPTFFLGILVVVYPAIWWGYSPPITLIPLSVNPIGNLQMFIVPAVILGMSGAGGNMRIIRTMMLEVLRQDYIRTAWAKGLTERVIITRHALKNALIPVVTMIGFQLPVLVSGAVIVEDIFSLPGLGQLLTNSVTDRDYPVVSGVMLFIAVVLVLINLFVDLSYGFLDPRIRYE